MGVNSLREWENIHCAHGVMRLALVLLPANLLT